MAESYAGIVSAGGSRASGAVGFRLPGSGHKLIVRIRSPASSSDTTVKREDVDSMISLEEAEKINVRVRAAFKRGGKSGNKAYTDAVGTEIDAVDVNAPLVPEGTGNLSKTDMRNNNALIGSGFIEEYRQQALITVSVETALDYGKMLWNVTAAELCGNCTEMACMAAHFVSEEDSTCNIWIVSTDGPGDHVFCAIGPGTGWKSGMPLEGILDKDRKIIIIDPWANTCCKASDYMNSFERKMAEWLVSGKRISAGGSSWVQPGPDYIAKIKASKADLSNARKAMPFT